MATTNTKEEARKLIDKMPDDSIWDDLMHKIYVRQAIESGLADSQAGPPTRCRHRPEQDGHAPVLPGVCLSVPATS
jgi:hypothetical protein